MQRSFSPGAMTVAILVGLVLLAGCGSTKHAASSTAKKNPTAPLPATSTTSSSASTQTATTTTPTSTTTKSATQPAKTTSTSHPTGGAGLPSGSGSGGSGSGSGGSTNARVPATFTIAAGGRLSPPDVSAPAFLAVQLTVVSHDGAPHQVLLRTPTPHSLAVPAHGHASVLIPGLRAGRYPLEIDGAARGALSIGGEPGP